MSDVAHTLEPGYCGRPLRRHKRRPIIAEHEPSPVVSLQRIEPSVGLYFRRALGGPTRLADRVGWLRRRLRGSSRAEERDAQETSRSSAGGRVRHG
eukprot:scaffold21104_cov69-Phaeocystis_antarctica.AAC.5